MESYKTIKNREGRKRGDDLKGRTAAVTLEQLQTWQILIQLYHDMKCEWCQYANQKIETARVDKNTRPNCRLQETHLKYWVGQKVCLVFFVRWLQWCLVVFNFI